MSNLGKYIHGKDYVINYDEQLRCCVYTLSQRLVTNTTCIVEDVIVLRVHVKLPLFMQYFDYFKIIMTFLIMNYNL